MESPFLALSTGPLSTDAISAIQLCTYSIADGCHAVAVWLAGAAEPRYFPVDGPDTERIRAWAAAHPLIAVASLRFASEAITFVRRDGATIEVFVDGDRHPFRVDGADDEALLRWLAWQGAQETIPRQHAAITLS